MNGEKDENVQLLGGVLFALSNKVAFLSYSANISEKKVYI